MPPSPELYDFIKQGLAAGKSAEELRASLANAGWVGADIDAAFAPADGAPPSASKPKKRLLWLWITIGAVALAALGIGAFFFLRPPGASPAAPAATNESDEKIADADLALQAINLAPDQNAYFALTPGFDEIGQPWPESWEKLIGAAANLEKNWNAQAAQDILTAYKDDLAAFRVAASRPNYQDPLFADSAAYDADAVSQYDKLRTLTKIAALDAYAKAHSRDLAGGRAEALLIADYGNKIVGSRVTSVGYLAGIDIEHIGLNAWLAQDSLGAPAEADLSAIGSRLENYADTSAGLSLAFKLEYLDFKKRVQSLTKSPAAEDGSLIGRNASNPYLFKPNKTLNEYADVIRADLAMTKEACRKFVAPPALAQDQIVAWQKMDTENAVGKLLLAGKLDLGADLNNRRCDQSSYIADFRGKIGLPALPSANPSAKSGKADNVPVSGDVDLSLSKINLPSGDNANLIQSSLWFPGGGLTDDDLARADAIALTAEVGDKEAAALATKAKDLIAAFVAASAKPAFQMPGFSDPAAIDAPTANAAFNRLRSIGNLVILDVNRRLAAGDVAGANDEALALVAYGQKIALSQANFNGYAVGMMMRDNGLNLYYEFMTSGAISKLPAEAKQKAIAVIVGLADTGSGLAMAMKMNYLLNKMFIDNLSSNLGSFPPDLAKKVNDSFYLDAQGTLEEIAAYERQGVKMATAACATRQEPPSLNQSDLDQMTKATYKNAVGEYIFALVKIKSNEFWNNWRCRQDAANGAAGALSAK